MVARSYLPASVGSRNARCKSKKTQPNAMAISAMMLASIFNHFFIGVAFRVSSFVPSSHLLEQMQIVAADRQHFLAAFQMDAGGFVFRCSDIADRPEVDHHRAMDLRKLCRIQLRNQVLQSTA